MRLRGKVAVITGGASGIGRASARLFAREGAKVVVADIAEREGTEVVEAIREHGDAILVASDLSTPAGASALVEKAVETYGRIDVLFNNSGVDHPDARSVVETSDRLWDYTLACNLKSVFLVSRRALMEMQHQAGGSIINTASIAGLVATPAEAAYCASKAGVVMLTRQMAIDFGPSGIRVNCVCPGPMVEAARDRRDRLDPTARAERLERAARNPLRRAGRPEDVAYAALFLASDEAAFITGTTLIVDGGYTTS